MRADDGERLKESIRRTRFRVDFVTPSVLRTPGPGRREDSRWIFALVWSVLATLLVATRSLLVLGARAGALTGSRYAGAALRSFMTSTDIESGFAERPAGEITPQLGHGEGRSQRLKHQFTGHAVTWVYGSIPPSDTRVYRKTLCCGKNYGVSGSTVTRSIAVANGLMIHPMGVTGRSPSCWGDQSEVCYLLPLRLDGP